MSVFDQSLKSGPMSVAPIQSVKPREYAPPAPTNSSKASSGSSGGSSSSSSSSKSASDAASEAKKKAEEKARKSIRGSYDSVRSGLSGLLGAIPQERQASTDRLNTQANFSRGEVDSARTQGYEKFDRYAQDIDTNQKGTLHDLSSDVRNAFQAGNIYLGANNASRSSAAGQYSLGIQQSANRNRADVLNQSEISRRDLQGQRSDFDAQAQGRINEIDNWFNTSVSELESEFNGKQQQIQMAMSSADAEEQQALANLNMQLYQEAAALYQQIEAQGLAYKDQVSQSVSGIAAGGAGTLANLQNQSSYDVQAPQYQSIDPGLRVVNPNQSLVSDNNLALRRRDDEYRY